MTNKTFKQIYEDEETFFKVEEKTKKSIANAIEYTLIEKEKFEKRIFYQLEKIRENKEISFQEIINCRRRIKECEEIVDELTKLRSELFEG